MRLLDTSSLELKSFVSEVPEYAILSHTWLDEEVTFEDLKDKNRASAMKGYRKLLDSVSLAKDQGYEYIWIDTCCIDKSSSAELSEAINSMYHWYKGAAVCYAYLSDIAGREDPLSGSRWFTRGWTLQELIAPKLLLFYSASWTFIGSRDELEDDVKEITRIPQQILRGGSLDDISAGCKMSWAASRVTTRPEDIAYCLMGIFDVNMPLLYGEGREKAFTRLQEEFLKFSDDESIFAWTADSATTNLGAYHGLLAISPAFFSQADSLKQPVFKTRVHNHPTNITNRGVRVELSLCRFPEDKSGTISLGLLRCTNAQGTILAIVLQRLSDIEGQYTRIAPNVLIKIKMSYFSIPLMTLSPSFREEYCRQHGGRPDGAALLRVADPESQLIFVRSGPRGSELLAGFYFVPEVVWDSPVDISFWVSDVRCPLSWEEPGQPGRPRGNRSKPTDYYLLHLMTKSEQFENLGPDSLDKREFVGGLEFDLRCMRDGVEIFNNTLSLVVGLEPLPENPFGTPPTYVQPWYALVSRPFDESWVPDLLRLCDLESLKRLVLPRGYSLKIRFSNGMRYEELFHRIELIITKT